MHRDGCRIPSFGHLQARPDVFERRRQREHPFSIKPDCEQAHIGFRHRRDVESRVRGCRRTGLRIEDAVHTNVTPAGLVHDNDR